MDANEKYLPWQSEVRSLKVAKLIEKIGLEGVSTLREVARKAGVSHNAPYRHLPSKESLSPHGTRLLPQLYAALQVAIAECPKPAERLHDAAEGLPPLRLEESIALPYCYVPFDV